MVEENTTTCACQGGWMCPNCADQHRAEISRLKAELEDNNAHRHELQEANKSLRSQLAEARAEVERLSALTGEWCKTAEMYRRFETETSKQTAREICDYLQRSSTDDEISKGYVIDHIKRSFGLEG